MRHVLLELSFVGTAYHGWQVQDNAVSVQRTVQDAIERITGVRAGLTGCSRTDAGVHARRFFLCVFHGIRHPRRAAAARADGSAAV